MMRRRKMAWAERLTMVEANQPWQTARASQPNNQVSTPLYNDKNTPVVGVDLHLPMFALAG